MTAAPTRFFHLAVAGPVVRSSLRVSLFVGTVLALINHGPDIAGLSLDRQAALQIVLTYLVPYCVSTYSSVKAMQAYAGRDTQGPA